MSINSAANYHKNQFFQKDHKHLYLPKISLVMVNKSTYMQVYNKSKQQNKHLLVYYSKATVAFFKFFFLFYLLESKNLNELE